MDKELAVIRYICQVIASKVLTAREYEAMMGEIERFLAPEKKKPGRPKKED